MDGVEDQYQDLSDQIYFNPAWIAANGTWIHSNNVLFYFMSSPFFDPTSENQQLLSQYGGTPLEMEIMGNKSRMESNLRKRRGLSYVVAHDPLESRTMVQGPNGMEQSSTWVIKKQTRDEPDSDRVKVLGYYYIVNNVIFQAPSVASILTYRILNTTTSLNKIFNTASQFPIFSASHGHTYVKPIQKSNAQSLPSQTQQSKESTPMSGTQPSTADKPIQSSSQDNINTDKDSRVVYEALQMTLRYGKEHSDDMPLLGEPGNFRFSKTKDTSTSSQTAAQKLGLKAETPAASRAPSVIPPTKIVSPVQPAKPVEKSGQPSEIPAKPKRRKSKVGVSSP